MWTGRENLQLLASVSWTWLETLCRWTLKGDPVYSQIASGSSDLAPFQASLSRFFILDNPDVWVKDAWHFVMLHIPKVASQSRYSSAGYWSLVLPNTENSCHPTFGRNESTFLVFVLLVEIALRLVFDCSTHYQLCLQTSLVCFSRCIKTFEVEFSPDGKTYQRINAKDTIFTLWVYSPGMARTLILGNLSCWYCHSWVCETLFSNYWRQVTC